MTAKILIVLFLFVQVFVSHAQDDGTMRRIRIPILMYHYVSEIPEDADDVRINLTVTPAMFEAQMQFLLDSGYSVLSLYEIDNALNYGTPLSPNPVVLTFDDGHRDHYTNAFPILQQFGFTGTFFIITDLADLNHPDFLSWQQVAEMAAAGMDMESHTRNHRELVGRDFEYLSYQLAGSLDHFTVYTGQPSRIFCYPVGRYDENTLQFIESTSILRAVTTQNGVYQTTDNRLEMPRIRVTNTMGANGLRQALSGN